MTQREDIRIAYLTTTDPNNRRSWSGIHSFMLDHLRKKFKNIETIGPLDDGLPGLLGKIRNKLSYKLTGRRFDYSHSSSLAKHYAKIASQKLENIKPDVIIAPTASTIIANLETKIPIILLSDVVFSKMVNYYEGYSALTKSSLRQSMETETKAIGRAGYCVYPSEWAAQGAILDHGGTTDKVKVIPFGANIHSVPEREIALKEKEYSEIRLLFLGVEWERKGGPIVLDTVKELIGRGKKVKLTVCGCIPPSIGNLPVEVIPFINKNEPEGEAKIRDLLLNHHFLFLPSVAECYGIVFVEAAACGCPSISRRTGGISGAVIEGKNGFLLSEDSDANDYADAIEKMIVPEIHRKLQVSSRGLYEKSHNWEHWSDEMEKLILELVRKVKPH